MSESSAPGASGAVPEALTDLAPPGARRWLAARKVLAIRLDNLGDVLMTTPALAAVRHGLPRGHISLLGAPSSLALAPHLPILDEIIPFAAPWMKAPVDDDRALAQRPGRPELELVERLAAARFDAAIVFTVCTQSALPAALVCRMAGIPLRLAHTRENPYSLLSDWVPDGDTIAEGMRHEVARQLALVASVGFRSPDDRLRFELRDADRASARRRLEEVGLPQTPYFIVHPGASAPSRRYPAEWFGIAADQIAATTGCTPVFTGSSSEQHLIDRARGQISGPSFSLAGTLALGELAAVIEQGRLLVANNTGPVHIAAALGTPVVDLYALTNPQHTPWKVPSRVLSRDVPCRYCLKSECPAGHHECLRGVAPGTVAAAALELL